MNPGWFAFEVTERCNLSCNFCYNVWHETSSEQAQNLSLPEIEEVLNNISEVHDTKGVTFTGGEPLLRNDIPDIARLCRTKGLKAALSTNGTLLSRSKVSELTASGIQHFDIGFTNPSHETRMAVTEAARSECTVTASICVHSGNYERIGVICEIAAALGADAIALNRFIPTGNGARNASHLNIEIEDLLHALEMANQAAINSGVYIYTGIPIEPCIASAREFPGIVFSTCQCGHSKMAIGPRGNLRICEQGKKTLGNLLENSLSELLQRNSSEITQFRKWRPSASCMQCEWKKDCNGGCRFG